MARRFQFRLQRLLERREGELLRARAALREAVAAREAADQLKGAASREAGVAQAFVAVRERDAARSAGDWRLSLWQAEEVAHRAQAMAKKAAGAFHAADEAAENARRAVEEARTRVQQLEAYRDFAWRQFRREQEIAETAELAETGAAMRALRLRAEAEWTRYAAEGEEQ